jgi:hypothetical protein
MLFDADFYVKADDDIYLRPGKIMLSVFSSFILTRGQFAKHFPHMELVKEWRSCCPSANLHCYFFYYEHRREHI